MKRLLAASACLILLISIWSAQFAAASTDDISARAYNSIQEAINQNPGRMVYLPPGDYEISRKICIGTDGSGLFGAGRIIQTTPEQPILEIERSKLVRIDGLTLTRTEGQMDTPEAAVKVINCDDLVLKDLQILDNRTRSAGISLRNCKNAQIRNCLIRNYMRISIDDRTQSQDWGYAFNCIDGTGIAIQGSSGTLIQGNHIIENHLLPTPELQARFELGQFVKRNKQRGAIINERVWREGYVNNWHQGSAILVSGSRTDHTRILGNYIENAAQGIDIHSDHVIISNNIVKNAFVGMKAMHGSRNVIITSNHFSHNDLWAIGLMPGAASHAATPSEDGKPAREANIDTCSIIAYNIISDFGYGNASWMWWKPEEGRDGSCPIRLEEGQKPSNPPLRDVIITGNIIYDTGRDGIIVDGAPKIAPPRYKYAVLVSTHKLRPQGLHFSNNIFHPGTMGISNVELKP